MNRLAPTLLRLAAGWLCVLLAFTAGGVRAAEVIPEAPTRYFNDYALLTKPETAERLNKALEDFERQTSSQLRVVIYPKLQTDSALEDYTQRVFRAWHVGEKGRNNGAVLFVFVQDRKLRIHTGYGLEGALPDAICKDIIADRISPKFKTGDFDGGLTDGVEAMMQAAKGEYKGTGRTHYEETHNGNGPAAGDGGLGGWIVLLIIAVVVFSMFNRRRRGTVFSGAGPTFYGGGFGGGFGGGNFGGGGSSWSSSSSSSSDGGGFASSGGGDSGGGGASGDW